MLLGRQLERRREVGEDPAEVGHQPGHFGCRLSQGFAEHRLGHQARGLLQQLDERDERRRPRHLVTAARQCQTPLVPRVTQQLLDQACLAHTGLAADKPQAPAPLDGLFDQTAQLNLFALPAHIRCPAVTNRGVADFRLLGARGRPVRRGISQPADLHRHLLERLIPVHQCLGEQLVEDGVVDPVAAGTARWITQNRRDRVADRAPLERVLAGHQLEDDHPEREDVGAGVGRLASDLLGRHVGRGAH